MLNNKGSAVKIDLDVYASHMRSVTKVPIATSKYGQERKPQGECIYNDKNSKCRLPGWNGTLAYMVSCDQKRLAKS